MGLEKEREVKPMIDWNDNNEIYCVVNPDGTYTGRPCITYDEARELLVQKEGRRAYTMKRLYIFEEENANGL